VTALNSQTAKYSLQNDWRLRWSRLTFLRCDGSYVWLLFFTLWPYADSPNDWGGRGRWALIPIAWAIKQSACLHTKTQLRTTLTDGVLTRVFSAAATTYMTCGPSCSSSAAVYLAAWNDLFPLYATVVDTWRAPVCQVF